MKSWKDSLWVPLTLLMLGIVLLLPVSSMAAAAEYVSLYPLAPQQVDSCFKTPCAGYIRHVTSFVNPGVLRGTSTATGRATLTLSLAPYGFPAAFRLFIPPGAVSAKISIFTVNAPAELAVRYQEPPSCAAYHQNRDSIAWGGYTLDAMTGHDVYQRERNIWVMDDRFSSLSLNDSGWLYIKNLNAAPLSSMTATIVVDLARFVSWYNGRTVIWDIGGDPWSAENGIPPLEVCDPDNLSACQESNCQTDGQGYWYNDVEGGEKSCHPEPACGGANCIDCLTESQCGSADAELFWYEDELGGEKSCHPVPACERDLDSEGYSTGEVVDCTPVNCITNAQCEDADFYWYEDEPGGEKSCRPVPACERDLQTGEAVACSSDNCITESQCKDSGFYWYEDESGANICYPMPACERDLQTGEAVACSPVNCITEAQCEDSGFYWYEDELGGEKTCHSVLACKWNHPDAVEAVACSPVNCITEAQCKDADFYWYGDECHEEPEQGVCSQDNLLACADEAGCLAAGGAWINYTYCGKKYTPSQTTPAYTAPAPTGTGGSTVTGGGNWFSGFLSPNSASAAPAAPVCDAQHPEACDQSGCEALEGFWWHGGACRNTPVEEDYSGKINQAPLSLGNGGENGIISAGDGLSFKVNVPVGERMYAVLSIPGVGAFFITNEEIFTTDVVPVATGTIHVIDNICPYLPAELMGSWTVYMLTVPASVGESLGELSEYLSQQGALYAFGSYQIEVNCQAAQQQGGLTLYNPLTGSSR